MYFARATVLAALAGILVWTSASAAPTSMQREAIHSCMTRAAAELGFNGVIYARAGELMIEEAFGTSDAAGQIPITAKTRFNVGSASKMFTAVAIGLLVDRGAVQFDAAIGRYLPDLAPQFASITVAQLLNHTSGLGDYFTPPNKAIIDAATSATDLLPLALAAPPAFAPGSKRAYSNSGFVVLGAIIEKTSGLSYGEFVRREILAPLAMRETRLEASDSAQPMTRMSPGGMLDKARPSPLRQLRVSPAGGIFSTVADVATFLDALGGARLLRRATIDALLMPRADPEGGSGLYGYGFNVRVAPHRRAGHGGGAPGVNAEIAFYPEDGRQLIALSNYDPPTASRMVTVLEKTIFAAEPAAACTAALADPALKAPMPGRP